MEDCVYTQFYKVEDVHWWFEGMRKICWEMLNRFTISGSRGKMRCLDVGCGTGRWTKELEQFGYVCGMDASAIALDFSRQRKIRCLLQAFAEEMPFVSNSWDIITALGVVEHLTEDLLFFSELYRVCAPGGTILVLTSAYRFLWSQHDQVVRHKRRYLRQEIESLLRMAGFDPLMVSYVNTLLFPGIYLIRLFQRLVGQRSPDAKGSPDVFIPAPFVNWALGLLLVFESNLLKSIDLPFGVNLIAAAKKLR